MKPKLLFCSTNPNTGRVDVTVVDTDGNVKHGTIDANTIANWIGQNITLTAAAGAGAGADKGDYAGQQRRVG